MEIPVILGLVWGVFAAALQYLHLGRSAASALNLDSTDPSKRVSGTLAGSMVRLLILTVLFLIAWKTEWIRLDVSVVTFAVFHLIFVLKLGFDLKAKLSPPEGPDKT